MKIKEIANLLNLELNEEFLLADEDGNSVSQDTYKFTANNLVCSNPSTIVANVLGELILGGYKVKKIPWKPQCSEYYYTIVISQIDDELCVIPEEWCGSNNNKADYINGLVFRTSDEARQNIEPYKKRLSLATPDISWRA